MKPTEGEKQLIKSSQKRGTKKKKKKKKKKKNRKVDLAGTSYNNIQKIQICTYRWESKVIYFS